MDELTVVESAIPLRVHVCWHERVLLAVTALDDRRRNKISAICLDCGRPVDVKVVLAQLKTAAAPERLKSGLAPANGLTL